MPPRYRVKLVASKYPRDCLALCNGLGTSAYWCISPQLPKLNAPSILSIRPSTDNLRGRHAPCPLRTSPLAFASSSTPDVSGGLLFRLLALV
ncbi:hypothetical protein SODALDRAFT_168157 [Sodiomyces alkalinus F11]|uniref:Uncharacterized protein n=1 Tax=Sodiomyces alkalinus (strain CBS 110278 / VKM F-3762 / F11) TaxID=1314773 RepID=A0A3N2PW19_SODAK|nr:hypothetical protein SODALDRAFT_168157 [Sodiomyces alkalinus F11]ROT38672.1 hypothetical protein SODALDRAFT_168157 [Sodiomyces alkalinus F11]